MMSHGYSDGISTDFITNKKNSFLVVEKEKMLKTLPYVMLEMVIKYLIEIY